MAAMRLKSAPPVSPLKELNFGRDGMAKVFAQLRLIAGALVLAFVVAMAMPAAAQQPNSVNPTAAAVKEQQLLDQLKKIEGRGTIPDTKSYVIEHPAGRDWREFRTVTLRWIGGIAILGILAVLIIFYLVRGMVKIESGRSGRTIVRFNMLRTLRALDDRDLLYHLGDLGPQHHFRAAAAVAVDRA